MEQLNNTRKNKQTEVPQTVESCDQVFHHDFQKLTEVQIRCNKAQKLDGETTERMRHELAELKKEMEEKKNTGQK